MNAHAQLIASLDDSQVTNALKRIDSGMSRMATKAQVAGQRVDSSFKRAGRLGHVAGDIAMSNLTSGAGQLVQQGAMIASVFGPTGALVAGLAAAAVLIWEIVSGTEEMERAAVKRNKQLMGIMKSNERMFEIQQDANDQTSVIEEERKRGKEAANRLKEEIDLRKKIKEIQQSGAIDAQKQDAIDALEKTKAAQDRLRDEIASRQRRREEISTTGQRILGRASEILSGPGARAAARRQERAENRAIRRAAIEEVNQADFRDRTESGIKSDPGGLTKKQREDMINARIKAADMKAKGQLNADISDQSINKLVEEIGKLLTK